MGVWSLGPRRLASVGAQAIAQTLGNKCVFMLSGGTHRTPSQHQESSQLPRLRALVPTFVISDAVTTIFRPCSCTRFPCRRRLLGVSWAERARRRGGDGESDPGRSRAVHSREGVWWPWPRCVGRVCKLKVLIAQGLRRSLSTGPRGSTH